MLLCAQVLLLAVLPRGDRFVEAPSLRFLQPSKCGFPSRLHQLHSGASAVLLACHRQILADTIIKYCRKFRLQLDIEEACIGILWCNQHRVIKGYARADRSNAIQSDCV